MPIDQLGSWLNIQSTKDQAYGKQKINGKWTNEGMQYSIATHQSVNYLVNHQLFSGTWLVDQLVDQLPKPSPSPYFESRMAAVLPLNAQHIMVEAL